MSSYLNAKEVEIRDRYGLGRLISPSLLEPFDSIPLDVASSQVGMTEKCHTYFKMKLWAMAFFITGLAVPVAVGLVLGSLTTVVLGLGIGGGVVALVALIALIYFQVRSAPARRWLEIIELMVNLNSEVKAKRLLQCLLKLTKEICQPHAGGADAWDLNLDRFSHQENEMYSLDVRSGQIQAAPSPNPAYSIVVIGVSMGIAYLRARTLPNDSRDPEKTSLIRDAYKLGRAFSENVNTYTSNGDAALSVAKEMDHNTKNPFSKIQFSVAWVLVRELGKVLCRIGRSADNNAQRNNHSIYDANGRIKPENKYSTYGDIDSYWKTLRRAEAWLNKAANPHEMQIRMLRPFIIKLSNTKNLRDLVAAYQERTPEGLPSAI
jgi:hypothetical protein